MTEATLKKQDYDNPWKLTLDDYLDEFMLFYFPDIYTKIDWTQGYESLDTEFQSVVRDANLGNQRADKLVKVTTSEGKSEIVYIHIGETRFSVQTTDKGSKGFSFQFSQI